MGQGDPNPSHFLKLATLTKMVLQHIKGFLRTGKCFLPPGERFHGMGHDKGEKGASQTCLGRGRASYRRIGSSLALTGMYPAWLREKEV